MLTGNLSLTRPNSVRGCVITAITRSRCLSTSSSITASTSPSRSSCMRLPMPLPASRQVMDRTGKILPSQLAIVPKNSPAKKSLSKQPSGSANAETAIATTDSKAPRQSFLAFTAVGDSIHEILFRGHEDSKPECSNQAEFGCLHDLTILESSGDFCLVRGILSPKTAKKPQESKRI